MATAEGLRFGNRDALLMNRECAGRSRRYGMKMLMYNKLSDLGRQTNRRRQLGLRVRIYELERGDLTTRAEGQR